MAIVLFVCKENAYRSQIAEALFNRMAKNSFAISASGAEPAKEVSKDAIKLLKDVYNIDMSNQKPKMLTEEMLHMATRVITVCDPKDCVLIPKEYKAEHWDIPRFEGMNEEEKIKTLKLLHDRVSTLVMGLEKQ
jgi:arsenate reductase